MNDMIKVHKNAIINNDEITVHVLYNYDCISNNNLLFKSCQ